MKNKFFKSEYSNNLKRNFGKLFSLSIVFLLLIIITIPLLNSFSADYYRNFKTLKNANYEYSIISKTQTRNLNVFYRLEDISTLMHNYETLNVSTYIQTDSEYTLNILNKKLGNSEIAISKKVADKLNLNLNDKLVIKLSLWEESKSYDVVEIFDYLNGFCDIDNNLNFPMIILPFDDNLILNTKGIYTCLLTEEEKNIYFNNNGSYLGLYNKSDDLKLISKKIALLSLIPCSVQIIVSVYFMIIINKIINKEMRKHFRNGFNNKQIKKFKILDCLIFIVTPLMLQFMIIAIICLVSKMLCMHLIMLSFMLLLTQILILLGDKKYEKVNRV